MNKPFNHNIKFEKCPKCPGTSGAIKRRIFYLTDRIEVVCIYCHDVVTFMKKEIDREKIERKINKIISNAQSSPKHIPCRKVHGNIKHEHTPTGRKKNNRRHAHA